ncbi:MAG: hypothetical protein V2A55_00575 [Candidatus Jorgensenbacteria bacterium]
MTNKKIIGCAFLNALVAAAYVMLIALFMTNVETIVGPETGILGPTAFLLTFVISAAVMGVVVFGRPVIWYLDGRKQEAIQLVLYTIVSLIIIVLIVFISLAFGY